MSETIESPYIQAAHSQNFSTDLDTRQQLVTHDTIESRCEAAMQGLEHSMDIDTYYHDDDAKHTLLNLFSIHRMDDPLHAQCRAHLRHYYHLITPHTRLAESL